MNEPRVRFAPSPTGFLHVGNARTALFNWLYARQKRGAFILRIEDTDVERSSPEYEKKLVEDISWLGLDWDEGPDKGGPLGPYRQSERVEIYREYARRLVESGEAYFCFCSPQELEEERKRAVRKGGTAVYSGRCRNLPPEESRKRAEGGERAAVRLKTPGRGTLAFRDLVRGEIAFDLQHIGDPIILRSTGVPAYNFAVVVDDALMRITHVIRGEDHLSNTPKQILVYRALHFPLPVFAHLSMVLGKDGGRLSKRHGAVSVSQFRDSGILPSALVHYMALLGWAPPEDRDILSKKDLISLFRLDRVSRSAALFDYDKLSWINRQHIRALSPREKAEQALPYLVGARLLPEDMTAAHWKWLEKAAAAFAERVDRWSELPDRMELFFSFSPETIDSRSKEELKTGCAPRVLRLFQEKNARDRPLDVEKFARIVREIKEETGCRGREIYHPLRIALTGQSSGMELDVFIPLVEEGARLPMPRPVKDCFQRVAEVVRVIQGADPGTSRE